MPSVWRHRTSPPSLPSPANPPLEGGGGLAGDASLDDPYRSSALVTRRINIKPALSAVHTCGRVFVGSRDARRLLGCRGRLSFSDGTTKSRRVHPCMRVVVRV